MMRIGWRIEEAPPLRLHTLSLARTDANSPMLRQDGRLLVFLSHYLPIGRSFRRVSTDGSFDGLGGLRPVRFAADATPADGKWLEAVWPDARGNLYGWYHAERRVPCERKLFLPRIAAARSDAEGLVWHKVGDLIACEEFDCAYGNGFLAGGYGDFTVVPSDDGFFYLCYSSYVRDVARQGVCVARYPIASRDAPNAAIRFWAGGADWSPSVTDARPVWPAERGWQEADPRGFWGPAVHWNRYLGCFVALLNRTAQGRGDLRQDGIWIAFNADPGRPDRWSAPAPLIAGGHWYPQLVGLEAGDGDARAGRMARLFIAGYSAWIVHFELAAAARPAPPLHIDDAVIARHFGKPIGKH